MVVTIEACPINSLIFTTSTPASVSRVPNVWRKSWNLKSVILASRSLPLSSLCLNFARGSYEKVAGFAIQRLAESIDRVETNHCRLTVPYVVTGCIGQPRRLRQCEWIADSLAFRYLSYFQFNHDRSHSSPD